MHSTSIVDYEGTPRSATLPVLSRARETELQDTRRALSAAQLCVGSYTLLTSPSGCRLALCTKPSEGEGQVLNLHTAGE